MLTGGNNGGYGAGNTTYAATIFNPGTVSFNWDYSTDDVKGYYDPAGWMLNGVFTQLSDNNTKSSSGNVTTFVNSGDVFGFFVNTVDNILGAASFKISFFFTNNSNFTSKSSSCSATYDPF